MPTAEAKHPNPDRGEPAAGKAHRSACCKELGKCNGDIAFNMPAPEAGAEVVMVHAPASKTRGWRGVTKAEKEPPDPGRRGPQIGIAGRSRVGLSAHDPGGGSQMRGSVRAEARKTGRPPGSATSDEESVKRETHGSARAKAPCDEGGGALKAGRPPGLRDQGHEREEFSEARGSAPEEPRAAVQWPLAWPRG